ncbi:MULTISPECIES: DUF4012 domain-containing protein [Microbacterium]|uniref:DUF4012 domain-containing protein n=1 Tax=Microbacterium saccharophilum TaxID=1213358 RepID=A0A7Z7GDQ7_9MICO|nr:MULTISPECIES: DUF4012 domain-containing protein [Microbacterium]SFI32442.1 Protein of unknown function [Microbacterium saccharophilum]
MAPVPRTGSPLPAAALLLCVLLGAFGWLGSRVAVAATEMRAAEAAARDLVSAVESGDLLDAADRARTLSAHTRAARDATSDPLWPVAETMPFFGDDAAAVRILSAQSAELLDRVLDPVLRLVEAREGAWDPGLLTALGRTLDGAGDAVAEARTALSAVDEGDLVSPVRAGFGAVRAALDDAAPSVDALAALAAFAGSATERDGGTVLLALQNPAELRTAGGITGSFVLLRAEGGRFRIAQQTDSTDFPELPESIVPVPRSTARLYGEVVGRFVQNATMPTAFARSAELLTAWWRSRGGEQPDAVVAIDPLAVRGLLTATGPVTLPDGSQLTAENLVQRVLVDPYMTRDPAGQTVVLEAISTAVIERFTSVDLDPLTWARALADPIAEGRVSVWTSDEAAQRVVDATVLSGPAGRLTAAGPDAFAVFLNDATGGKMDTFLHADMELTAIGCRGDGRVEIRLRVTMRSTAPAGAGDVLPPSMTGHGLFGTGAGDIGTSVSVAAPAGTYFGGVTKDGAHLLSVDVEDEGRPTSLVRINLSPGEVNVVEFGFLAARPGSLDLRLVHTPLVNTPAVTVDAGGGCR